MKNLRAFVVTVPVEQVDLASDRLWELGVRAVEERAANATGSVELWTSVGEDDAVVARAASMLDVNWTWRLVDIPSAPASTWRDFVDVTEVSDTLHLVPAWIHRPDSPDIVKVRVEPGGAFGLGDHPTTRLCAAMLESTIVARIQSANTPSVLDVGCGSGVLSIVASLVGAREVRAIDVSADAVVVTRGNALANGVEDLIDVDTTPYAELSGSYDVVVANILAPVLIAAAHDLRRLTAAGGTLIISGVLMASHDHVIDALAPMVVTETRSMNGWAAVALRALRLA